jgi:hypothetical protein
MVRFASFVGIGLAMVLLTHGASRLYSQYQLEQQWPLVQQPLPANLDFAQQKQWLNELASPEYQGRASGTAGGLLAQAFIVQQMQQIGLTPVGSQGFLQPYHDAPSQATEPEKPPANTTALSPQEAKQQTGVANILGMIVGTDHQQPWLVVTAHYDHLGMHEGRIFHGADDNASGVATMLALAAYFKKHPPKHSILFAALDQEEVGMWGAQALLDYLPKITQQPIKLNINLDMLSRDTEQQLFAVGSYHYPAIKPLLQHVQQQTPIRLIAGHDKPWWLAGNIPDWTYASDHGHFHRRGIPFIYFGVPDHPDYHQPTDTADRVSTDFYQQVSETVLRFVLAVDASNGRF